MRKRTENGWFGNMNLLLNNEMVKFRSTNKGLAFKQFIRKCIHLYANNLEWHLDWHWPGMQIWLNVFSLIIIKHFPVLLHNWLISFGLEVVFSHTDKLCIASYYILFSTNIKCIIIILKSVFWAPAFSISGLKNWF